MKKKSRLLIYDTSDFTGFPIGGQLTSVRNFLTYLCTEHSDRTEDIMAIGVTGDPSRVGSPDKIKIAGKEITFFPVAAAETDLGHTAHSLRLRYAKGLLKYGKRLNIRKQDCNYIHTPEAYGPVKLFCPGAQMVIFSHGSYANMERGFRFFRKNILVRKGFVQYLHWIIRDARLIFVLDEQSRRDYLPFTDRLLKVSNSIIPDPAGSVRTVQQGRLLFAGRLSADKGVLSIIRAVEKMEQTVLTILGDGEKREELEKTTDCSRIFFKGAVAPEEVRGYMREADILIMNSAFEGMPMTILEALGCGLPVVSTNVGGIGECVSFGRDAEETDGSPDSICRAVEKICSAYGFYAENAAEHGKEYDYRTVNRPVYQALAEFWKE